MRWHNDLLVAGRGTSLANTRFSVSESFVWRMTALWKKLATAAFLQQNFQQREIET